MWAVIIMINLFEMVYWYGLRQYLNYVVIYSWQLNIIKKVKIIINQVEAPNPKYLI